MTSVHFSFPGGGGESILGNICTQEYSGCLNREIEVHQES